MFILFNLDFINDNKNLKKFSSTIYIHLQITKDRMSNRWGNRYTRWHTRYSYNGCSDLSQISKESHLLNCFYCIGHSGFYVALHVEENIVYGYIKFNSNIQKSSSNTQWFYKITIKNNILMLFLSRRAYNSKNDKLYKIPLCKCIWFTHVTCTLRVGSKRGNKNVAIVVSEWAATKKIT